MQTQFRLSGFLRHGLALTVVAGASVAMAAQTPSASAAASTSAASTEPTLHLVSPAEAVQAAEPAYSSSVTPEIQLASLTGDLKLTPALNAMQYGGRRSGRPRYRGEGKNADGSNKYEFYAGVGTTSPVGNFANHDTLKYGIQAGVGRNFNERFGLNVEFNWDNFNLNGNTLANQQNLYNFGVDTFNNYCLTHATDPNCQNYYPESHISGLDAYSHIWSLSLQPVYKIPVNEGLGAYLTAGVGFYHKITTFTVPGTGCYFDYYYGEVCYSADQPIDSYTSNAPGVNAGLGLTYKFSRFSNERLYVEAKYVYTFNSPRAGIDVTTATSANVLTTANEYPANSERTSWIPVKVGIRF